MGNDAQCPKSPTPPELSHPLQGPKHPFSCEPFQKHGCSATIGTRVSHGCVAQHGFPGVAGHGGCASAVVTKQGWVHTKCCAGELGHVGPKDLTAKPRQPHLRIHTFETLAQCIATKCPMKATTDILPCRCTYPTHVCSSDGPDHCVAMPKADWTINRDATCQIKGPFYTSIESCAKACLLQSDCMGFEVEKATLRICRLFNQDMCHSPIYGPNTGTHLYTSKHHTRATRHRPRPSTQVAWDTAMYSIIAIFVLSGILLGLWYIY